MIISQMQIEHWSNISLTSYLWSQLTRVVHMLKQKCTVDEPKVLAMYLNNSVQRLVPWWLLTWLLVSTLLRHDPVFAFQNLIWRSAVPPPLARTFGCHGHQAKAYIKKYTSYTGNHPRRPRGSSSDLEIFATCLFRDFAKILYFESL